MINLIENHEYLEGDNRILLTEIDNANDRVFFIYANELDKMYSEYVTHAEDHWKKLPGSMDEIAQSYL